MPEVTGDTVEAFASLFKGRSDAHGQVNECIYEPATLKHYEAHLRGEVNLGIYFLLDDSTCYFAAIDLDQKNFTRAKAIRDELTKVFIPAYIAASKSKGFHIYTFALERFKAAEIRQVLNHILHTLNIKAEVFPKQDTHQPNDTDGKKHPGSYINIPCFGFTRPFLTGDIREVPLETALSRIKFTPQESIDRVLRALPKEKVPKGKQTEETPDSRVSKETSKLAVEKLLESCAFIQYCRDNAATLPEPFWWSMIHCFVVFGDPGKSKIHELSRGYSKYTKEETNRKIEEAEKAGDAEISPHTCLFIEQNLGFACPEDCQAKKLEVKAPAGLAYKLIRVAGLPIIIITNRFLREKTTDTIAAVKQANTPPRIFERSGDLVRISQDEFGSPYIETLTESACRGFIERAASFFRVNDKGKTIPLPAPPLDVIRDFMSFPHRELPALIGITEVPVLRSDGSILIQPGYDEVTHLYYQPDAGLTIPTIPDSPSQKQLNAAVTLLQEPLTDFPFDSEASRTNALAALLTPVCRPMISGLVPLCLLDKPQPGTGASLLSDVVAIIATGRPAVMMAPPKTDEECEKRLGSILLHGQTVVIIDNIEGYLYFPSLAMLLTANTFLTRILGQSKMVLLPNRCSYIVTGNNVKLGGDMPRRCYLARMDARIAQPWMRDQKSFKYQHLLQWVKENRGELLAAILTMARGWIAAKYPIPEKLPVLGSFEDWTNTIGGILTHAGLPDFLGNLAFMYSKSDVETPQWENFLEAWTEIFGEEATTTVKIIEAINEYGILAGALPDTIDRDPKKFTRSLGSALSKRMGVRYSNGLMITKKDKPVHHAIAWQVINYQKPQEVDMEI